MTTSEKWEKEFDEKFPCIQKECDGYGRCGAEGYQCQFHTEYLDEIKEFINSLLQSERDAIENHAERLRTEETKRVKDGTATYYNSAIEDVCDFIRSRKEKV